MFISKKKGKFKMSLNDFELTVYKLFANILKTCLPYYKDIKTKET